MSRIHEALKKAQEQRMAGSSVKENKAEVMSVPEFVPLTLQQSSPSTPSTPGVDDLTIDTLLGRCPKNSWNPDAKDFLTYDFKENKPGTEEFRTLRSRLYQLRLHRPIKRVLVTSALPGEGKTFVCINLASAFVRQRGRRALLIDADLRCPKVHSVLGAPSVPGLSEYLKGEADVFAIVQRGSLENLFVITAGKHVSNASELIAGARMKTLLDQLSACFDWVILDSPAAIPASDASLLANLCDGVLLVVRSASTPFDLAQKARQEFQQTSLLGAVLNRASSSSAYRAYYALQSREQAGKPNGRP